MGVWKTGYIDITVYGHSKTPRRNFEKMSKKISTYQFRTFEQTPEEKRLEACLIPVFRTGTAFEPEAGERLRIPRVVNPPQNSKILSGNLSQFYDKPLSRGWFKPHETGRMHVELWEWQVFLRYGCLGWCRRKTGAQWQSDAFRCVQWHTTYCKHCKPYRVFWWSFSVTILLIIPLSAVAREGCNPPYHCSTLAKPVDSRWKSDRDGLFKAFRRAIVIGPLLGW